MLRPFIVKVSVLGLFPLHQAYIRSTSVIVTVTSVIQHTLHACYTDMMLNLHLIYQLVI